MDTSVGGDTVTSPAVVVWDAQRVKKFCTMMFSVILIYLAMDTEGYAVNEYTQNSMKRRYFPNEEINSNFSACSDFNRSSAEYTNYTLVQQEAAKWQMYNTIAIVVPTIPLTTIYQSYTDTYGRRFLLILGTTGILVKITVSAIVIYTEASLLYIVLGCVIQGLAGSSYSILSSSYSYVADITSPGPQRSFLLALDEGLLISCSTVAGFTTGYFIQYTGYFYPALTATCLALSSLLMMLFLVQESLNKTKRSGKTSIIKNLKRTIEFYTSSAFKGRRTAYILLLLAYVFSYLGSVHRRDLETLYQLGLPFCWLPTQIGYFAALRQIGQGVIGIMSTKLFQKCQSDEMLAVLGLLANMVSYGIEALAKTDAILYLVAVPATFAFLTDPMIRGVMSAMTSEDKQGALFASLSVVQSVCWLTATVTDNTIYSATLSIMNGFVFLVMATICGVSLLFLGLFVVISRKARAVQYETQEDDPAVQ